MPSVIILVAVLTISAAADADADGDGDGYLSYSCVMTFNKSPDLSRASYHL